MCTIPDYLSSDSLANHGVPSMGDLKPIIDNSLFDGDFTFENCDSIHVGPKYENSNNVIINQDISVSSEVLSRDLQNALREELKNPDNNCQSKKEFANRRCILLNSIAVATFSLTVIMIFIILNFNNSDKGTDHNKQDVPATFIGNTDDYPLELQFVTRQSWGAAQPVVLQGNNTLPVRRVIFIHTAGSSTCNKFTACAQAVRDIQDLHMDDEHKFGDIGYNFILGSDGYIYVGVGWDRIGAHTRGFNNGSLGVAFIGDFRRDVPNAQMISAATRLLEFGVKRNKLSEDYQLFGHCQMHAGWFPVSPGKNIFNNIIKNSEHWNKTNVDYCTSI